MRRRRDVQIGHVPVAERFRHEQAGVAPERRQRPRVEAVYSDPRSHIYEEVAGVKRKVKAHLSTDAAAPLLFC